MAEAFKSHAEMREYDRALAPLLRAASDKYYAAVSAAYRDLAGVDHVAFSAALDAALEQRRKDSAAAFDSLKNGAWRKES